MSKILDARSCARRIPLVLLAAFTGCAHIPDNHGIEEVRALVQERAAQETQWAHDDDANVDAAVKALLDEPLTPDSAVQIALFRNPDVAIAFAELGMSRADLIEAGTLPNPTLSGMARFVTGTGSGTNAEAGTAFPLLDAFMLPLRRKVETRHFEHAKLRAAERLLEITAEVRAAYYAAFSVQREKEVVALTQEASSAAAELARRQYDAGNLSRLERLSQEAFDVRTRLDARAVDAVAAEREQQLRRAMGLRPGEGRWFWPMRFPAPSAGNHDATALESLAVTRRLDLAAAAHEVDAMEFALKFAKRFRYTGLIDLGVSGEREPDGTWVVGPTLDLEVPIFDRKRGEVMRAASLLQRVHAERAALELDVRTEVRAAAERLSEAHARVDAYANELLPIQAELLNETQLHYNGMLIGVYDLLEAKQAELDTERNTAHALLDYWLAYTELERLTAGPLPEENAAPANEPHDHEE